MRRSRGSDTTPSACFTYRTSTSKSRYMCAVGEAAGGGRANVAGASIGYRELPSGPGLSSRDHAKQGVQAASMDTELLPLVPSADELLDALGHAVIATDTQGTVLSWNSAAEQLYGWPAAEAVGRVITEVTVPELSRQAAEEIMAALREGRSWSGGFPVRDRSGKVLHALVTDSGVYRDGTLIGIVGASLNLGDAVRHLMERSSDAAVVVDEHHVVSYASPA